MAFVLFRNIFSGTRLTAHDAICTQYSNAYWRGRMDGHVTFGCLIGRPVSSMFLSALYQYIRYTAKKSKSAKLTARLKWTGSTSPRCRASRCERRTLHVAVPPSPEVQPSDQYRRWVPRCKVCTTPARGKHIKKYQRVARQTKGSDFVLTWLELH